jgi:two-component system chemotaxis response regulator CheB
VTAAPSPLSNVDAIVIGTSAGGVDALSVILPAIDGGYHGAILVVLHLPRERPSLLVDIFGPKCALSVREAEDKEPVAAGTVYFAPSDYHLLVEHGPVLALSMDAPVNFSRPSIDVLFESAAEVYGPRLLGVILTGASDDGAAGLEAVSRAGGMTCVQDPSTAYASLMVTSALRRVRAHHVLGLAELAEFLRTVTGAAPVGEGTSS